MLEERSPTSRDLETAISTLISRSFSFQLPTGSSANVVRQRKRPMKTITLLLISTLIITSPSAFSEDIPSRIQSVTDKQERTTEDTRPMALAADLTNCSVERVSEDTLKFTITVAAPIPQDVENRSFYAVYMDLDNSVVTGNCDRHRGMDLCVYSQKLPGNETDWNGSVILDSYFTLKHTYKVEHKFTNDRKSVEITATSGAFIGRMDFLYRVTSGVDCYDVMPSRDAFARYYDLQ